MESTESSYVSSPEQPRKKSPPPPSSPLSDAVEKPTYIKLLVSNAAAGSVIGKGGATITDFQSQSGARIQLSKNYEFFPGTSDRIILISGGIDDALKALELIIAKLLSEIPTEDGDDAEPRMRVRLVVPNNACGSIIGKGGSIIKSFIEESHAGIKISPLDTDFLGLTDRLVAITGTLEEQMHAIDLILSKLTDDTHYLQNMHAPLSYAGVFFSGFDGIPYAYVLPHVATAAYNSTNHGPNGAGVKFQHNKEDRTNSVTIGVADEHIGLVVGRGGRNIMEISQNSGARIKISDRGDFMSGTNDRKITITGSQRAIHAAEDMIMQKLFRIFVERTAGGPLVVKFTLQLLMAFWPPKGSKTLGDISDERKKRGSEGPHMKKTDHR